MVGTLLDAVASSSRRVDKDYLKRCAVAFSVSGNIDFEDYRTNIISGGRHLSTEENFIRDVCGKK